jgi:pectinesterase
MEDLCDASFKNCRFLGEQDTLYLRSGIARFDNCYIEGDIDFICGGATVLFSGCHLHLLNHDPVFITAASPVNECIAPEHPRYEELTKKVHVEGFPGLQGFIFHQCIITMDGELKTPVHMGRGPWRNGSGLPDGIKEKVRSSVTYIDCEFGTEEEPLLLDTNEPWCPMDAPMESELYRTYACRVNGISKTL